MLRNRSRVRVHRKPERLISEFCLPARQACEAGGNGEGMRIEQGEHMSFPPKFEDVEPLQLARELIRTMNSETVNAYKKGNPEPLNPEPL